MCLDDIGDVYQLRLLRKRETTLRLALNLAEWIARCQKILDQIQAAVPPHKHEVADLVCDFEATIQEIASSFDVAARTVPIGRRHSRNFSHLK